MRREGKEVGGSRHIRLRVICKRKAAATKQEHHQVHLEVEQRCQTAFFSACAAFVIEGACGRYFNVDVHVDAHVMRMSMHTSTNMSAHMSDAYANLQEEQDYNGSW